MIAAVVVTYSTPADVLDRCLRSVLAAGGVDRVLVVDTGGSAELATDVTTDVTADVTADVTTDATTRVDLTVIENRGYGAAANHGFEVLRAAGATRIALLNDDVVVDRGWIEPLAAELIADGVGAAQPMLVGGDRDLVTSLGVRLDRYGAGSDIGDGAPVPGEAVPAEIEMFTAGAVLFDTDFLQATGGFDERFFLYYEDVDLSLRGRALGWRYVVVPTSIVEHRRGTSTSGLPARTRYLQERNRLWTAFRFADAATIARAVWLSVRRLRHRPRRVHARALAAGLAGAPTRLAERLRDPGRRTARH